MKIGPIERVEIANHFNAPHFHLRGLRAEAKARKFQGTEMGQPWRRDSKERQARSADSPRRLSNSSRPQWGGSCQTVHR
jgi:hypothetical protein